MMKIASISVAALCLCALQSLGQGAGPVNPQHRSTVSGLRISAGRGNAGSAASAANGITAGESKVPASGGRAASSSHHLLQTLNEEWVNGAWRNNTRTTSTYDAGGYEVSSLEETWDTVAAAWQPMTKDVFTNGSNGRPTQVITQQWNDTTNAWENATRTSYTYSGSDKVSQMLVETWVGDAWLNYLRTTQTFGAGGYATNALSEMWDTASAGWKPFEQEVYTNNSNGTVQQSVLQLWDTTGNAWTDYYRISYTYNAANKPTQEQMDFFVNSLWFPIRRTTHTYDGNNNLIHDLDETATFGTGTWKNAQQADYTNDAAGDPTLVIGQVWNDASSAWENSYRTTMTYDTPGGVASARADEAFALYPNPAVGHCDLNFTLPAAATVDLSLVDGLGRTVATIIAQERMEAGEYHRMVDVGSLANGSYLAVLRVNGASTIRRVELVR
ncbi:MAG TPA: hypothetical protein VHI13_10865 [Candidatus Kapabacteria bacterium]|nr:hypothetical protein [Candidatus Kapabacteria bacterium]